MSSMNVFISNSSLILFLTEQDHTTSACSETKQGENGRVLNQQRGKYKNMWFSGKVKKSPCSNKASEFGTITITQAAKLSS